MSEITAIQANPIDFAILLLGKIKEFKSSYGNLISYIELATREFASGKTGPSSYAIRVRAFISNYYLNDNDHAKMTLALALSNFPPV